MTEVATAGAVASSEASADMGGDGSVTADPSLSTKAPARKERVKIDGAEIEVDVEELKKDYQKFKASEKRFQEAAELRKQAQQEKEMVHQLLDRSAKGDLSWLKGLVPEETLRHWAESELLQHIEWQKMPEAERRAIEAERKAQHLQSQITEITQTQQRQQATATEERAYQQIESEMVQTIKELGYNFKITPRFIRRIAEQLSANLEASQDGDPQFTPMPANVARDRAFKGFKEDTKELLSILTPEEVLDSGMVPPSVFEAYRKRELDRVSSQFPSGARPSQDDSSTPSRGKAKQMSTDEFFRRMDERTGKAQRKAPAKK